MLNQIIIIGRLIVLPQFINEDNRNYLQFTLEVNRPYAQADGIFKSDHFKVLAWRGISNKIIEKASEQCMIAVKGSMFMDDDPIIYAENIQIL